MSTVIDTPDGKVLLCKVGALNVGRITLDFSDHFVSNTTARKGNGILRRWLPNRVIKLEKAGGLGCFELGSTVVMVADKQFVEKNPEAFSTSAGSVVRMGENF